MTEIDSEYGRAYACYLKRGRQGYAEHISNLQNRYDEEKENTCELEGTSEIQRRKSAELCNFLHGSKKNPKGLNAISKIMVTQNTTEAVILLFLEQHGIVAAGIIARLLNADHGYVRNKLLKFCRADILFEVDGTAQYETQIEKIDGAFKKFSCCHNRNVVSYKYYGLTEIGKELLPIFDSQLTNMIPVPVRRRFMDRSYKMLFVQNRK